MTDNGKRVHKVTGDPFRSFFDNVKVLKYYY